MNGVQGIKQVHVQILTRVWNYNEMKANVDGDGDDDDEDDVEASKIEAAATMDSLCEFPLQIPFGGEVSLFRGGSVTLISDPIARGERVWRDEATDTWYGHPVRAGMTVPQVIKVSDIVSSRICPLARPPGAWVNVWKVFIASNYHISVKKWPL